MRSAPYLSPASRLTRWALWLLAVLFPSAFPAAALAQEYVVAVAEENFRARPNGAKLGTLRRGATVDALKERGRWVQASLRGWIWKPSVAPARGKARLRVSVARENLRASPAARGRLLGTVLRGTEMEKIGERGSWARVEYDGWVWEPSLTEGQPATEAGADVTPASPATWSPDRTVSVAKENLRAAPNGRRLGSLQRGGDLAVLGRRGSWLRVATRGWFWSASARGSGAERRVAKEVENLRIAPGSEVVGVLAREAPMRVLGRAGRWLEVEVRGWLWEPSTRALEPAGSGSEREAAVGAGVADRRPAADADAATGPAADGAAAAPAERAATEPPRTLARSIPLKDGPDGTLIGQALAGSRIVPLRAQGDWVKVRVEGWVPRELVAAAPPPARRPGEPVTVGMVAADPEGFRGAETTWRLELISVEQADRERSDFRLGEHYLLTRNVTGEREYVYVAISAGAAEDFRELSPFTPITVRGVVRTGRSALVGNPILELRELIEDGR